MRNIGSSLTLAVLAGLGLASQALAHAHLASSVPADKETVVGSPAEVDLSFTEALNLKFSGIKITGPRTDAVEMGAAKLTDGDKGLAVPIPQKLEPGPYQVQWHALSADGHKTTGAFSFTVK